MPRTAIYMRVSTDQQNVQMQRDAAATVLSEDELSQCVEYVDDGVSALKLKLQNRPQLQRLISDISNRKIEKVVVYSRDRIARDPYEWIKFWKICRTFLVPIIFSMRGHAVVTDNAVIEMLYGQFGADEGKKIIERTRQAQYFSPRRLIGYEIRIKDNGEREYNFDPTTAPVLAACFAKASCANTLEDFLGVVVQYSSQLNIDRERIIQFLRDERYTGTVVGRDGLPRFPKIVEPPIFDKVGELLGAFTNQVHHVIGTKLVVPRCGLCSTSVPMEVNTKELTPDWVCRKHRSISVSVTELNERVKELIQEILARMDPEKIREVCLKQIERVVRRLQRQAININYQIEHLAVELTFGPRQGHNYQDGVTHLQQYRQKLAELHADLDELRVYRSRFERELEVLSEFTSANALTVNSLTTLVQILLLDVVVYRHSIQLVVAQADIWDTKLEFHEP